MTDEPTPETSVPLRGLWGRIRGWGGIIVSLVGMHQQDRLDKKEWERTEHTWTWHGPGGRKHRFTGTPEQYRRFKKQIGKNP